MYIHTPHADSNHFTCASFRLSLPYIWPHFWLLDPSQTCGCLSQRQTRGPWHLLLSGLGMRVRTGDSKRMGWSFPSKFSSVKEEKRDMYQPLYPLPFSLPCTYRECDLGPEFQTLPKEGSLWRGGINVASLVNHLYSITSHGMIITSHGSNHPISPDVMHVQ